MQSSEFLGLRFDRLTIEEALTTVSDPRADEQFRYVVTPNVDHVIRLETTNDPEIHAAYAQADLSLCDSQVLRLLAAPFGIRLSAVPGSDLVLRLIPTVIRPNDRVVLVGGDAEVEAGLRALLPIAQIASHFPPMGMLHDPAAMATALAFVENHPAEYILLCCGSPQQELIAYRCRQGRKAHGTALCIGAGVDFLVDRKRRAPLVMRRVGLEWLHRLLSEPRRLWRRYLVRGPMIVVVLWRWLILRRSSQNG